MNGKNHCGPFRCTVLDTRAVNCLYPVVGLYALMYASDNRIIDPLTLAVYQAKRQGTQTQAKFV